MQTLVPADLWTFLATGGQLRYDPDHTEAGQIHLHSAQDLRVGHIYVAAHSPQDPNLNESGVYRIPAISLVASCEHYEPDHLLTYLPFEQSFAVFDGDHARVTVFPGASWADILCSPTDYLNSLWSQSPAVQVLRDEHPWWERYVFFKGAFE